MLLRRIETRTSNDYGKHPAERDLIHQHLAQVEPLLRRTCTHELDATRPIGEIADELVRIGQGQNREPDGMRERAATSIQPQLWVDDPQAALAFYAAAFGATTVHLVGSGDDVVAQLAVGEAAFWIAPTATELKRLSPRTIDGATSRTLLVVDDPYHILAQAVAAGATQTAAVSDEHGWRLGRIIDPFGHEWEIGKPLTTWPPP